MLSLKAQENFVKVWNPNLFIIAEEALSRGLSYLFQKEGLVGFYKCGRSSLFRTHLLYADDTLVFCNGSKRSISNLAFFTNMMLHQVSALTSLRVLSFSQGKQLQLGRL